MPRAPLHDLKRRKNLTMLGILVGICAALFYLSIFKIRGA